MDEMLKKQDVLDAIYATMEKTDKPDVVLGLAAAMSTVKQMEAAPVKPAEKEEPCTDAISRQAVMDCFKKWQPYMATRLWDFEKELSALPSVNPTKKVGQWEWVQYDGNPNIGNWHCSECNRIVCGAITAANPVYAYKYCPECGAKMQEVENE